MDMLCLGVIFVRKVSGMRDLSIRCRELTYPKPKEMLRLTLIVLACSALLTALVWAIDAAFASVLLPPVLRKMAI